MKSNATTKALTLIAAIKADRTEYDTLTPAMVETLTDAGFVVKPTKTGKVSIGQGTNPYRPADAWGILMGLRATDQRSVDGWRVPCLLIDGRPATTKQVLERGRRVAAAWEWSK